MGTQCNKCLSVNCAFKCNVLQTDFIAQLGRKAEEGFLLNDMEHISVWRCEAVSKFRIQARLPAIEAARKFVSTRFPNCNVAFLTGSAARGEETPYSDLDILVISDDVQAAYVEAFRGYGWMIEILMHNRMTYKHFFELDRQRGRPSLPHMFATGIVLVDNGTASEIQLEARHLLDAGPPEFNRRDVGFLRFVITNHLLDLEGGLSPLNAVFTVNDVANTLQELVLRSHGRWIGKGKGIVGALADYDQAFAKKFEYAFQSFYISRDVQEVVTYVDKVLEEYGGRFFEGYSSRQL